ncbi:putative membrane protein [Heliorestis convoluta]|uniref:Putative membrane protein n=1 Tax=Heliorestis convoluta TaxID=356322 RepID=A0A5Q2N0S4_9FIRM|nr:putative membrane protein [Heliorestis convoluta]
MLETDEGLNFFKGLIVGTFISIPLWTLLIFFLYRVALT